MGHTRDIIEDVRSQIAVDDDSLAEARRRRTDVMEAAMRFPGALRAYRSGSLAHGTANKCADGDCGVVLDRRTYTDLGPDSDAGHGPNDIVEEMHQHLRAELVETYPDLRISSKGRRRSIEISFNEEADTHGDPTVDLIVGLNRKDEDGIWIPNLKQRRWDASHPEKHAELLTAEPKDLRVLRARVIRIAKAQVKQHTTPTLTPFNIAALALEAITELAPIEEALLTFYTHAAHDLAKRNTPDPANVSPAIKLQLERDTVVSRMAKCRDTLTAALDCDDDQAKVQAQLHEILWDYVENSDAASLKQEIASMLRSGTKVGGLALGIEMPRKSTRSYGSH